VNFLPNRGAVRLFAQAEHAEEDQLFEVAERAGF
jgi:hypothetical protein